MNQLLAALPMDELARIAPQLSYTPLRAREVLHKREAPLRQVFFPGRTLCSLVLTMEDGATAEIAVVGSEGIVGIEAALGVRVAASDATVQVAGDAGAFAMTVDAFREAMESSPVFESLVRRYAETFVRVVMQSVACNARHAVDERCCRWLLQAHDRLATDDLELTHDLLSTMLGVRRPTVTLVISDLVNAGVVSTSRGMVRIVNREALEARACKCYRAVPNIYGAETGLGSKLVSGAPDL
jgi:CRP-like cAMP-binding protein